jgi:chemotaxis methyl-accepting protein methylase
MRALGLNDYQDYKEYLHHNIDEEAKLLQALTINLSFFFRNMETFNFIENYIFPDFKKLDEDLVFWSAGCAHGEEPYSLAICARENSLTQRLIVFGTDIDNEAIETGRRGTYGSAAFQYTPDALKEKYFTKTGDEYVLKEDIKRHVRFYNHDIFDSPVFGPCDLIMCRNVLIYMDRKAQSALLRNFYENLKIGGYLIIGKVELLIGIPEAKLFEVVSRVEHVYRKSVDDIRIYDSA